MTTGEWSPRYRYLSGLPKRALRAIIYKISRHVLMHESLSLTAHFAGTGGGVGGA